MLQGFGVKDIVSSCRDSLATMISHLIKSDQLIQLDDRLQQTSVNSTHIKNIFEKGGRSKDESSCIPEKNCITVPYGCSKSDQNCSKLEQNCSKPDKNCSRHLRDNAVTVFKSCSIVSNDSLSIAGNDHDGPLNCSKDSNFMYDSIVCSIRNKPGYKGECSNGTKQVNEELEARTHDDNSAILELDDILEYEDKSSYKGSISGVLDKFENGKPADSDLGFLSSKFCDVKLINIASEMQKTSINHHKNGRIKSHYSRHLHQTEDILLNADHTDSIADNSRDCGDTKNNVCVDHIVSVANKFKKSQCSVENIKKNNGPKRFCID